MAREVGRTFMELANSHDIYGLTAP